MSFAPQQNWSAYEDRARAYDAQWLRALTPNDRLSLCEDMYKLVFSVRGDNHSTAQLEAWRWRQKVAARLRFLAAVRKLDLGRHE
ncbi:MAG: hypothetical protein WBF93_01300 [Pirellulales bacterium]